MLVFHIGGQEAEYVRVSIIQDYGDGWFSINVDLAVGAFRASYSADFSSNAFSEFHRDLEQLSRAGAGSAMFTSLENQLELSLSDNASGQIEVRGEAMDSAGTGNRLSFQLHIDQTYLPAIINDLRNALQQYPPGAV
jgi:hypothetical protein